MNKLKILIKSISVFKNWYMIPLVYLKLIKSQFIIIKSKSGLIIKIRVNSTDLMALIHVWIIEEYRNNDFQIKNNDVVIDIGAHIGLFALYASQFCKHGTILCYEPIKENYELLLENISLNKITNIKSFNLAVSKEKTPLKIFLNNDESGHSMFGNSENFILVNSTSLDEIFKKNKITQCEFLKLDCEGAEYEIIQSLSPEVFPRISKMVIEYHLADKRSDLLNKLINTLKNYSYILYSKQLFSDIGFLYVQKIKN